ncbi:MAG TPA: hypothetical protein DCZ13_10045 [Porticoccaceae bacterium]|nr:hypothetical protein [Porticoccaceae bacterium]
MIKGHQKGLSSIGLLIVLAIAAFLGLLVFKIGPLYLDNYFVNAALQSLGDEQVHKMSNGEIRSKMSKYFSVNGVRDINVNTVEIERKKTHTEVRINYEKRVNILGNVDAIVTFDNLYESRSSSE